MPIGTKKPTKSKANLKSTGETNTQNRLKAIAKRLATAKAIRSGLIALRLTGPGGGNFYLDCTAHGPQRGADVVHGVAARHTFAQVKLLAIRSQAGIAATSQAEGAAPIIEVIGDRKRILAILEGKKDARMQFLAGRIRVSGDLRYLSNLAMELGILKEPLL